MKVMGKKTFQFTAWVTWLHTQRGKIIFFSLCITQQFMITNQATVTVFLQVDVGRIKCTTPGCKNCNCIFKHWENTSYCFTVFLTLLSSPKGCNYNKMVSFFGNTEVLIGSTNTESQDLHINLSWRNGLISADPAPTPSAWIT